MKCSNCGNELTPEMFSSGMCFSCGQSTSDSEKAFKEEQDKLKEEQKKELERQKKDMQKQYAEATQNHMLTTFIQEEKWKFEKARPLKKAQYRKENS